MRLRGFAVISLGALALALAVPAQDNLQAHQTKSDKTAWTWRIIDASEYKVGPAGPSNMLNVRFGDFPTGPSLSVLVEFKEDPGDVFTPMGPGKGTLKNPVSGRFALASSSGKPLGNCVAYLRPVADGPGYRNLVFEWPKVNDKKFVPIKDMVLIDANGYFAPLKAGALAKRGPERKDDVDPKDKEKDKGTAKKTDTPPLTAEEKEAQAAEKLDSARQVLKDGNVSLARLRLQSLIDMYPSTKAAGEAKELLLTLMKK